MMENQFSFLLTLFLLSKFLKQVLIIFTMISWFDGASIINTCNNPLFQLSGNKRNWFRVTVMSFHQQIKTDMTILNHRSYKFGQTNFNDFSRTNYSFQWLLKTYSMNQHFLSPFWTMESFTIFTSSAIPLSMTTLCNSWVWLQVTSEVHK